MVGRRAARRRGRHGHGPGGRPDHVQSTRPAAVPHERPAMSRRAHRDAARPPVRPRRADDRPRGRAEPRGRRPGARAAPARAVLDALGSPEFQTELGRWNLELNLPPRPLPGEQWRHFEQQLLDELAMARAKAQDHRAQLAVIGILPTLATPAPRRRGDLPGRPLPAAQRADAHRPRRAHPARHHRRRPARVGARAPAGRLRLDRSRGGVHVDAAAPAGGARGVPRLLERRAVPGGRAARGRRELTVPAGFAAVGGDPDPAVRAVVRRPPAGAAQPGRAAAGVVRRAVDRVGARPVRGEQPLLPRPDPP